MTKKFIGSSIIITLALLTSATLQKASGQSNPQQIMDSIYRKYDSLAYLTFDVTYIYSTDTLNGKFKTDVMMGTYTMAGKKALYTIGDIEFLQNDSFFISVYTKDKFIIVANPATNNAGSQLPMRSVMDSMMLAYAQHYTIKIASDTNGRTIQFLKADNMAQFEKFVINYDEESYFLNSIKYVFDENETINDDDSTGLPPQVVLRKKTFTIKFSNYRAANFSTKLYSENNYIWFEDGECKPVDKFKGFKVYYSRSGFH